MNMVEELQEHPSCKTVTRTIRVSRKVAASLDESASKQGVTFNAVANRALQRYAAFDRFANELRFLTLPRETIRALIDSIDDDTLRRLAVTTGSRVPRDVVLYFFRETTVPAFLDYLRVISTYNRVGSIDVSADQSSTTITVHHDLGGKWSTFLCEYLSSATRRILGVDPRCEVGDNLFVLRLEGVNKQVAAPDRPVSDLPAPARVARRESGGGLLEIAAAPAATARMAARAARNPDARPP